VDRQKTIRNNIAIYFARQGFFSFAVFLVPVVVEHAFLMERGVSYKLIGTLGAVVNAVSAAGTFLFAGVSDRYKKFSSYKAATAIVTLGYLINKAALLIICLLMPGAGEKTVFAFYLSSGAVYTLMITVYGMLELTLPLRITNMDTKIGRLMGVSGFIAGICGVMAGMAVNAVTGANDLNNSVIILCVSSVIIMAAVSVSTLLFMKPDGAAAISMNARTGNPAAVFLKITRMEQFKKLLAPNISRSVYYSCVFFFAAVGIKRFQSATIVGYTAVAITLASAVGNILLAYFQPKIGTGKLYFMGSAAAAAGVAVIAAAQSEPVFLAALFIMHVGQVQIDIGFPVGIFDVVPSETVGEFSAIRLFIFTVCVSLFTYLAGALIELKYETVVYAAAFVTVLASGGAFYRAHKQLCARRSAGDDV